MRMSLFTCTLTFTTSSPFSYDYKKVMLVFYELNKIYAFKQIFIGHKAVGTDGRVYLDSHGISNKSLNAMIFKELSDIAARAA